MAFTDEELERYARHIILREIGGQGQQRLKAARVLVVGAGGLGAPVLMYLAAAGVGTLGIVDDDVVDLSNLQRQVIHTTAATGKPKTASALKTILGINPNTDVIRHDIRLDNDTIDTVVTDYDLVLDGTDNFPTRYTINAACVRAGLPLIAAAISQWEGQISVYDPRNDGPCFSCVFPRPPADGLAPSCAEAGVIGALPGVIGTMMSMEAIKLITGVGASLKGRMMIYDALYAETRCITVARNPDCAVCGS